MGLFDTIHFDCLNCNAKITKQTTSGECKLHDYFFKSVPVDAAADLNNTELTCPNCNETFYIGIPSPRVSLILTSKNKPDEVFYS